MDIALWDIAGKAAGLPIHRLMGTTRTSAPAYASSAVLDSPEAYAEEAVSFRDGQLESVQDSPPRPTRTRTSGSARRCARPVGDGYRLMLDSTWSYDYPAAVRVGRAAERLGFYWYEDPARR